MLPGQSLDGVVGRIEAVAAALEAELRSARPRRRWRSGRSRAIPALTGPRGRRFAADVAAVAGAASRARALDFGTEAGLYQQRLGVPVVVCGPGSMAQGHTPDEYLTVAELTAGARRSWPG